MPVTTRGPQKGGTGTGRSRRTFERTWVHLAGLAEVGQGHTPALLLVQHRGSRVLGLLDKLIAHLRV